MEFSIGNKKVGDNHPTFIIAELSGNHHQKFEEAKALVRAAKEAGADAVKLQTYTPDTLTLNSDKKWFVFKGENQPKSWQNKSLYDLYEEAHTPWEWQPKLKKLADELGIMLFSSPFDDSAVDFLEQMNIPCYKIASYEAIHIPLLKKIASTGKPVIMSVGFASPEEIELAVKTLKDNRVKDLAVLHCVTAYSDKPELANMNLRTMYDIKQKYEVVVGFSDNNAGIEAPVIAATFYGASIIEKHLTLNREDGGPDSRFSLEPDEFKEMVSHIRDGERKGLDALEKFVSKEEVSTAMGEVHYGPCNDEERENLIFRPSIWAKADIKKGETLTTENIRVARPQGGMAPKYFEEVLGKKAACDITVATPLTENLIE